MGRGFSGTFAIFLIITSLLSIPSITFGQSETSMEQEVPIFFNFTMLIPDNNLIRQDAVTDWVVELRKIGIEVNLKFEWVGRIVGRSIGHPDEIVPTYDNNGFDSYMIQYSLTRANALNHFGYMGAYPLSSYDNRTIQDYKTFFGLGINHINYFNRTYMNLLDEYYQEWDVDKRLDIFNEAQGILNDDLPMFGVYSTIGTAIINENWNLTDSQIISILDQTKPSALADLNFGTKETLKLFSYDYFRYNPLDENDFITQFVFQTLYENNIENPTDWVPLIADSMPVWNENHTIATVNIRDDVFFADGHQLDSEDVKESFLWYLELNANRPRPFRFDQNIEYTRYFNSSEGIKVTDPLTLEFRFKEPTIWDMNLLNVEILPFHIYGSALNHSNFDINQEIFQDLIINGTSKYGFGTGPFTYGGLEFDSKSISLHLNASNNYWKSEVQLDEIILSSYNERLLESGVSEGEIDLGFHSGGGPISPQNRFSNESLPNVRAIQYDAPAVNWFAFNMIHPVFGTGVNTPLGGDAPNIASNAARYVRKAMRYALPRDYLNRAIQKGQSIKAASTHLLPTFYGTNKNLEDYDFDLTKSRFFMEKAGYKYPKNETTLNPTSQQISDQGNSRVHTIMILVALIAIRRVFNFSIVRNKGSIIREKSRIGWRKDL